VGGAKTGGLSVYCPKKMRENEGTRVTKFQTRKWNPTNAFFKT
jgi:hypothetical protein